MKKILIVEDEKDIREALALALKEAEFEVFEADNGSTGEEVAFREHPDLIFLDIIMPEEDGIAFLKKLRVDAWGENAKVVLLTNLSSMEKIAEAAEYSVKEYIVKSDVKLSYIVDRAKEILKN
jgi:DNA-binding response OmpR family regulator